MPSDLRIGDTGPDVERWQRVVGCTTDGIFGPNTARATRIWQGSHGLDQTGAVTAEEWAALAEETPPEPTTGQDEAIPTVLARSFRRANRTRVDWVVIHTAECSETNQSAEALARYCAGGCDGRGASWHYSADADSIVRSVPEQHVAYATRTAYPGVPNGADERAIHIELAGRASQDAGQWGDEFSAAMLDRVARLVADICRRWSVPPRHVEARWMVQGMRGIVGHVDVSRGPGKGRTNHTDPGSGFPWDSFVDAVERYYWEAAKA